MYVCKYIYNRILFSHIKKKGILHDNMDLPGGQYAKRNKPDRKKINIAISLICGI